MMSGRIALTENEYIADELEYISSWNDGKLDNETINFIAFIMRESYRAGYEKGIESTHTVQLNK